MPTLKESLDTLNAETPNSTEEFIEKHTALIGAFIQATRTLIDKTSSLEKAAGIEKFNEDFLREILPLIEGYVKTSFNKLIEQCISNPSNAVEVGMRDILEEFYKLGEMVCRVTFRFRGSLNSGWKLLMCIADAFSRTNAIEFKSKDIEKTIDLRIYKAGLPENEPPAKALNEGEFFSSLHYQVRNYISGHHHPRAFVQTIAQDVDSPDMVERHFKNCLNAANEKDFALRLQTHKKLLSLICGKKILGDEPEFSWRFAEVYDAVLKQDKNSKNVPTTSCLERLFLVYLENHMMNLIKNVPSDDTSCQEFVEQIYNFPALRNKHSFALAYVGRFMETNNVALLTFAIRVAIENKISQTDISLYQKKLNELKTTLQEKLKNLPKVTSTPIIVPAKPTPTLVVSAVAKPSAHLIAGLLQGIIKSTSPEAIGTPSPAGVNQNIDELPRNIK